MNFIRGIKIYHSNKDPLWFKLKFCLKDIIFKTKLLGLPDFLLLLLFSSSSKFVFEHFFEIYFFREKLRHTHTAFFKGEIFHYEITQHSHTISRSLVLCLRFISRTISANTSLTFVRCLALASTKEQPHIWAKAWKKKKENIITHIIPVGAQ